MTETIKSKQHNLKLQDIRQLVEMLEQSSLSELELEMGATKLRIAKAPTPTAPPQLSTPSIVMVPGAGQGGPPLPVAAQSPRLQAAPAVAAASSEVTSAEVVEEPSRKVDEVLSPMVGTFYRAPAPGAESFVKIGDVVHKGQALCIIEAMKLMNDIESEFDGRIVDILVENANPVEYGEKLFLIEAVG